MDPRMPLTYYKTNLRLLALALLLLPTPSLANIGTVTAQIGREAKISRDSDTIDVSEGTGIEMNDTISTTRSKLMLTFDDDTKVSVTQQSKLVVDDFIYDPSTPGTGKLAMNVAMGTVRYASGAIARNNRNNVNLRTPTATIAVRGTDFTMTVDEIGRSLIILLPTCPDSDPQNCFTGVIEVSSDVGMVILNQAFQATVVTSKNAKPTKPKILDIRPQDIDNMLIIAPPKELPGGVAYIDQAKKSSFLEDDAFLFEDLITEYMEDELTYGELEIDWLDFEFLDNILDLTNMLADDELKIDPVLPNIHQFKSYIQYSYNENGIFLFAERPPHVAQIRMDRYIYGYVNIEMDGVPAPLMINDGGTDVIINITQTE